MGRNDDKALAHPTWTYHPQVVFYGKTIPRILRWDEDRVKAGPSFLAPGRVAEICGPRTPVRFDGRLEGRENHLRSGKTMIPRLGGSQRLITLLTSPGRSPTPFPAAGGFRDLVRIHNVFPRG